MMKKEDNMDIFNGEKYESDKPQEKELEDILEIIIITYNRGKDLERTLRDLFAKNCPVRGVQITILNNSSTDNTDKICNDYTRLHSNIKCIKHPKNIGGNANVCRAFEISSKEYTWVLADDDHYNWSFWPDIYKAMQYGYDCIFTTLMNLCRVVGDGSILYETTFLPGCIYRTEWITSDVLQGMYSNIHTSLPHVTISLAILKNNGRFYIPCNQIVYPAPKIEDRPEIAAKDYKRGQEIYYSPFTKEKYWEIGFLNMISVLGLTTQEKILSDIFKLYGGKKEYMDFLINNYKYHGYLTRNMFDIYWSLPESYKNLFIKVLYDHVESDPMELIPLSLNEWNLILADSISKSELKWKKQMGDLRRYIMDRHKIKKVIKKTIVEIALKLIRRFSTPDTI
jgi:glycosyltransferase involved in cell wall biosynthesis